jgi:hypothetical protein
MCSSLPLPQSPDLVPSCWSACSRGSFLISAQFFLVALSSFEWVSFEVLNLGLDLGLTSSSKVLVGLFQSISVRASGIGIISLSAVAPAVQFLYMSWYLAPSVSLGLTHVDSLHVCGHFSGVSFSR